MFGEDDRRIRHALRVLELAKSILAEEGGDDEVVVAAALLHDIGIPEAEREYGSADGRYQERLGPPTACAILERLGMDEEKTRHVCAIIGAHHSGQGPDTVEFRILWDADWLVNAQEEFVDLPPDELRRRFDRIFRTRAGRTLADAFYLTGG